MLNLLEIYFKHIIFLNILKKIAACTSTSNVLTKIDFSCVLCKKDKFSIKIVLFMRFFFAQAIKNISFSRKFA
jgi:hypothetical protein